MCLLVIAWQVHPRYRLVVAANRDEFHERPTEPMARWPAPDDIIAGRDLRAGGTWLGIDQRRRFGIVTNFRELQRPAPGAPSRGNLIPDYLRSEAPVDQYIRDLQPVADQYSGFNLLLTDHADPTASGDPIAHAVPNARGDPIAQADPNARGNPIAQADPTARGNPTAHCGPAAGADPTARADHTAGVGPTAHADPTAGGDPAALADRAAGGSPAAHANSAAARDSTARVHPATGNRDSLWYLSNRAPHFAQRLQPGIYGLSNELLDTPWPKLQRVRKRFDSLIEQPDNISQADLFAILADPTQAGVNDALPETGLSKEWEQLLSSPFISNRAYGTRCSTVLLVDRNGSVSLTERRFGPEGLLLGDTHFDLGPNEWP